MNNITAVRTRLLPSVASYEPHCRVFITDSYGDQLWHLDELRQHYPRVAKAFMRQVKNGSLSLCRNGVKMYFIMMYQGVGYESN